MPEATAESYEEGKAILESLLNVQDDENEARKFTAINFAIKSAIHIGIIYRDVGLDEENIQDVETALSYFEKAKLFCEQCDDVESDAYKESCECYEECENLLEDLKEELSAQNTKASCSSDTPTALSDLELIKQAKEFEKSTEYVKARDAYIQASQLSDDGQYALLMFFMQPYSGISVRPEMVIATLKSLAIKNHLDSIYALVELFGFNPTGRDNTQALIYAEKYLTLADPVSQQQRIKEVSALVVKLKRETQSKTSNK
jgi:hypothetical protein